MFVHNPRPTVLTTTVKRAESLNSSASRQIRGLAFWKTVRRSKEQVNQI